MKLYRTSAGQWLGTQDDARRAAKAAGGTFDTVEVPTTKPELLAWLNATVGAGGERNGRSLNYGPANSTAEDHAPYVAAGADEAPVEVDVDAALADPGNHRAWLLDWQRTMKARSLALDLDVALVAAIYRAPLATALRLAEAAVERTRDLLNANPELGKAD